MRKHLGFSRITVEVEQRSVQRHRTTNGFNQAHLEVRLFYLVTDASPRLIASRAGVKTRSIP